MISYVDRTITLAGRSGAIAAFAVWFRTPAGLFATFEAARDHCVALGQDVDTHLAPVTVAVGADGLYEEIPR